MAIYTLWIPLFLVQVQLWEISTHKWRQTYRKSSKYKTTKKSGCSRRLEIRNISRTKNTRQTKELETLNELSAVQRGYEPRSAYQASHANPYRVSVGTAITCSALIASIASSTWASVAGRTTPVLSSQRSRLCDILLQIAPAKLLFLWDTKPKLLISAHLKQ